MSIRLFVIRSNNAPATNTPPTRYIAVVPIPPVSGNSEPFWLTMLLVNDPAVLSAVNSISPVTLSPVSLLMLETLIKHHDLL